MKTSDRLRLAISDKEFWATLWTRAPFAMWEEEGLDLVRFGPIRAACMPEEPEEPGLNFILGCSEAGAVEHGHLADAFVWLGTRPLRMSWAEPVAEEFGVDFRVPVVPGLPGAALAERWLGEQGAVPEPGPAKLVRDTSPPRFALPAGIEVLDWDEWDDGFPEPLAESLELPRAATSFFACLPVESDEAWSCFAAVDANEALAYAAMWIDSGVATLIVASRPDGPREGAGQIALLHRCIQEAAAAGCDIITVANAGHEPPVIDRECLLRAGFRVAFRMPTWRSPVRVDA
jgi:hypothetical protein